MVPSMEGSSPGVPDRGTVGSHQPGGDAAMAAASATLEELLVEIERLEAEDTYAANRWDRANLGVGIPAALLASAGGATSLAAGNHGHSTLMLLAALAAVLGGGLTAVATTVNAGRKAEDARARALAFGALRREARRTLRLDLDRFSGEELREALEYLESRLIEIQGLPPQVSAYRAWKTSRSGPGQAGSL
jgi:hypothetical protein